MNNYPFKKQTVMIFILLGVLGCGVPDGVIESNIEPQCIETQSQCSVAISHGKLSLMFGTDRVLSETSFPVYIQYTGDKELISVNGYLEGVNMYMGKIPLMFATEQVPLQQFKANGLLGSCTQNEMIWKMVVHLTFTEKHNVNAVTEENVSFSFSSFKS